MVALAKANLRRDERFDHIQAALRAAKTVAFVSPARLVTDEHEAGPVGEIVWGGHEILFQSGALMCAVVFSVLRDTYGKLSWCHLDLGQGSR
jgi:hypothetical protein